MKYLILFLISFNLWANYLPESKVGQNTDGMTIHSNKSDCEAQYSEPCIEFSSNESYKKIKLDMFLKEQVESCVDDNDCQLKHAVKSCLNQGFYSVKNLDLMESYCTKFEPRHVVDDMALKASHASSMATIATQKQTKRTEMTNIRDKTGELTSAEIKSALKYILSKSL